MSKIDESKMTKDIIDQFTTQDGTFVEIYFDGEFYWVDRHHDDGSISGDAFKTEKDAVIFSGF